MKTAFSKRPKFCQQTHHKHQKPSFKRQQAYSNRLSTLQTPNSYSAKQSQNDYTKIRKNTQVKKFLSPKSLPNERSKLPKILRTGLIFVYEKFCVKSPKFADLAKNCLLYSKVSRKNRLLLRMEIFGGTYMRRW